MTLRIFNVNTALQKLCTLKPGQTPNVDVLRPTIDWTTAADWESYTTNYLAQVVADLDIAQAGAYTFRLLSDDGSQLWIDGQQVIDHDGVHGATTKDGDVTLTAGSHALEVRYFQVDRRSPAPAAVAPPGPDHVRDGPELRVLGRGRRRARRRARHQGVRERRRPAGRRLAAADGPPQLHAEQPAPDAASSPTCRASPGTRTAARPCSPGAPRRPPPTASSTA